MAVVEAFVDKVRAYEFSKEKKVYTVTTLLLFGTLVLLLVVGFVTSGRGFTSPVILFLGPIIVAIALGLVKYTEWSFDLSDLTMQLIVLSAIAFVATCMVVHVLFLTIFSKKNPFRDTPNLWISRNPLNQLRIPTSFYLFCAVFQICACLVLFSAERTLVSKYGYGGNFFVVINAFNDLSKFTDADVLLTGIPGFLVIATTGISSVIGCLFAAAVTNKGIKGAWVEAVVFGISLLVPMVSGGRMGTFGCLVSFIAVFVLIQERAGKITGFNQIRLKSVSLVLAGFAGVLIIFYLSQLAIGREEDGDLINHVLIYLAAPIKNLDIQLSAVIPESSRFGQYSFPGFYATIANKISYDPSILLENRHPFVFYNGENLGNVYTVFRDLYIDFHFFGTVIAVAIMAAVSQTVYECAKRFSLLSLCIYFYISFNVMMSFFSDNFFAVLVSTQPIKWLMTVLPVVIVIYLLRKPEDSLEDSLEDSSYQEFSLNGTIDKSVRLGNVAEC